MGNRYSRAFGILLNDKIKEKKIAWSDLIDEANLFSDEIKLIENNLDNPLIDKVFHIAHVLGIKYSFEETTRLHDNKKWRELRDRIAREKLNEQIKEARGGVKETEAEKGYVDLYNKNDNTVT